MKKECIKKPSIHSHNLNKIINKESRTSHSHQTFPFLPQSEERKEYSQPISGAQPMIRGKSLQKSHRYIPLPKKMLGIALALAAKGSSCSVYFFSGPRCISCAAAGFQAETDKCEPVEKARKNRPTHARKK